MTANMRMNTCRLCGKQEFGSDVTDGMVQYSTRSYAHHRCYLEAGKMLTDLQDWKIVNFPYRLLKELDLVDFAIEAMQRIKASEQKWEEERARGRARANAGHQCPECCGVRVYNRAEGGFSCAECGCQWSAPLYDGEVC